MGTLCICALGALGALEKRHAIRVANLGENYAKTKLQVLRFFFRFVLGCFSVICCDEHHDKKQLGKERG